MTKKSERARVLKERNALSSAKYAELNRALCGFVSRFLESAEVKTIGAFLPIGSEPNISEVLEKWLRVDTNRRVFLPVTKGKTMRFAYWDPEKPLKIGRFDVGTFFRTPASSRPLRCLKQRRLPTWLRSRLLRPLSLGLCGKAVYRRYLLLRIL